MVLSEETLLAWKDVIIEGPSNLKSKMDSLTDKIQQDIITALSGKSLKKKEEIVDVLPYDHRLVDSELRKLKGKGVIKFSQRQWILVGGNST